MGKLVRAVKPFVYKNNINFKQIPFEAWKKSGGKFTDSHKWRGAFQSLSYHLDLPALWQDKHEARLCFVEGVGIRFHTFPDYLTHEVIPLVWDCWPACFEAVAAWLKAHKVRTAIFTSSQTAERMRKRFSEMNILTITEGINTSEFKAGKELRERQYGFFGYGRCGLLVDTSKLDPKMNAVGRSDVRRLCPTHAQLIDALADSAITIALTRFDNEKEVAQGIDTLTQRYWECMLSRNVIVGRAPKELTDLIGYDPVIPIDYDHLYSQINDIWEHIEDYQILVDRNRDAAMRLADWSLRMEQIQVFLKDLGYTI